ncbi:MAG: kelch repeat-containing protein [Bacteroidia bacterium]
MKKIILTATFIFFSVISVIHAQGAWTQKANVGTVTREGSVSFTIGTKAYITGGKNNSGILKDLWEWDQSTNTWTQKANFPGTGVYFASGFSIGNKGYICLGFDGSQSRNELWEWDQATNTWSQKTNFPGTARCHAVGFSLAGKGYISTGQDDNAVLYKDFWEWDQSTNTWTQKPDFAGNVRQGAVSFCIGTKAYISTGQDYFTPYCCSHYTNDLWEWDSGTGVWTQKADFTGTVRYHASGFSAGSKGYIGFGLDTTGNHFFHDFWEWDQGTNQWVQKPDPGVGGRWLATGFSIGGLGYFATGGDSTGNMNLDLWQYDPNGTSIDVLAPVKKGNNIFPNPNNGTYIISIPDLVGNAELDIYNTMGQKIYHRDLTNPKTEIILDAGRGIYFNKITANNKLISSGKIEIE